MHLSYTYLTVVATTCVLVAAPALYGAALPSSAVSQVIDLVPVGDAGNWPEWSGTGVGGAGPDRLCGAVDYDYQIGRFEVTASDYVTFLNAVAATDPYELYAPDMIEHSYGCRIERSGVAGSFAYSVPNDWARRPVNFVNWGDAARYANWLSNGQPSGAQGPGTTEDGSYALNGAMTDEELTAVVREPAATYVIPTEDEWYKAAYHQAGAPENGYWSYPTQSHTVPGNDLQHPDPGNSANFYELGYTIGFPYYRTEVGAFTNSGSSYGTYDQGGNVKEWTEEMVWGNQRCVRGGSCFYGATDLNASKRVGVLPAHADNDIGLRIALVPEPVAGVLLMILAAGSRRRACHT